MAVLITTTVSLDTQRTAAQAVIHLKRGDAGTRTLRFVPVSGGAPADFTNVSQAKVRVAGDTPLLLSCALGENYADMTPTGALTATAGEKACELALLNAAGETLTTATFTIMIHESVYPGDAVEHTNAGLGALTYDADGRLTAELLDGTRVKAPAQTHTHANATSGAAGFMSAEDKTALDGMAGKIDQDVKTTGTPTFATVTVGSLTIGADGTITGARFT